MCSGRQQKRGRENERASYFGYCSSVLSSWPDCVNRAIKCSQALWITPQNRCFYSLNPHLSPSHPLALNVDRLHSRWQVLLY